MIQPPVSPVNCTAVTVIRYGAQPYGPLASSDADICASDPTKTRLQSEPGVTGVQVKRHMKYKTSARKTRRRIEYAYVLSFVLRFVLATQYIM